MNEQTKNTINAFVKTLREMFMIDDAAELDFGIYRIMAHKKAEIETFFGSMMSRKRMRCVVK